jgi:glutaredoxin
MNSETSAGSESAVTLAPKPVESRIQSIEGERAARVYYQFVDQRGSVRFVERLDDVPAEWRDRVGFVELDSPPPLSPADSQRTRGAHHAAAPKARVVLYFADWCPYCARARKHLDRRGVAYDLRDVDIPAVAQELLAKAGSRSIPVIDIGGRVVRGYNAGRLDELLEGAGLL